MWELEISDRAKILPVIFKLAEQVEPRHGITIRRMTPALAAQGHGPLRRGLQRGLERELGLRRRTRKKDLDVYAQEMQLVFDRNWFMVAETADGETAAIAITIPDINQVLKKMNGRLLPLGWWHFLRKGKTIDRVRVGFLGVKPEYQHTGVAAALYVEHFDTADATPQKWGEMGWILETNRNMNRAMEAMGGRIVRRFRVYEQTLKLGQPDL